MKNTGDLHSHKITKYDIEAVLRAQDYIKIYEKSTLEVFNEINSHHLKQLTENKNKLHNIIKSVLLLAHQNIPFCDHWDDRPNLWENSFRFTIKTNYKKL